MSVPSFEEVYTACHRSVYALCRNLVGNRADAQDAVQETFLAVALALPRFRGDASITTWVHRIAVRTAVKVRARHRRPSEPLELDPPASAASNPAVVRDTRERLARAMDALSFDHRLVISLFAIEGLTHAEIAAAVGVPEGTIWSRLHAAKKQRAAALGPTHQA